MTISQALEMKIETIPTGVIFGYRALPHYNSSPMAVIKAVNRMVKEHKIARLSKGKFYTPKIGMFGVRTPSDSELIRSALYKDGRIIGYITGLSLYNKLGLTTQIPNTITIALNGGRQNKNFETIKLRIISSRIPINSKNVQHLEYLDALKDIKRIPDSDINISLKIIRRHISEMSAPAQKKMLALSRKYYSPQVRALIGLLFTSLELSVPAGLPKSLNPTTTYKLNLSATLWPTAKEWNITNEFA